MENIKYKKISRIETESHIIYTSTHRYKYTINVVDKATLNIEYHIYNRRESINNVANKFGINFIFR